MEYVKVKTSGGIGRRMLYRAGERIFSEGQTGKEMYVVESGKIRIFLTTQNRELTLAILKRGDFFGEMALLEDLPRSAGASAMEETRLIAIGKDDFKFLIREHPEIAMKVLGRFSGRLRDADSLINLLLLGENTGLVIGELVKLVIFHHGTEKHLPKECLVPVTLMELSEMTGLELDHIEQILQELSKIGLASKAPDGIIVRRHTKLKSYLDYFNWRQRSVFK
jgi:CRP/FNR family transcriptional regulator, cyclic AMP receptor protein